MTALRELAEWWKHKAKGYPPNGDTAFSINRCATELLSILDAEGDDGVVACRYRFGDGNGGWLGWHYSDTPTKKTIPGDAVQVEHLYHHPATPVGMPVAWQQKRRPEDYPDEWRECGKETFDVINRTKDSPWVARELFDHPQPVRYDVVSDEQVDAACRIALSKYRADCPNAEIDGSDFDAGFYAALEHFTKSQGESNV